MFSNRNTPVSLQDQARATRLSLLEQLRDEADNDDAMAVQLVAEWEAARNDPAVRLALLRQKNEEEQLHMAVSVAKHASREAAIAALHEEQQMHTAAARDSVLQLNEARTLAVAQLRRCQESLDRSMDLYLTDVSSARQERGLALAESERQELLLGKVVTQVVVKSAILT